MTRYDNLFRIINENKITRIMEIGTYNGRHAIQFIREAQQYGSVQYYGFDLFDDMTPEVYQAEFSKGPVNGHNIFEVQNLLKITGAEINLYKGNTRETLPEFLKGNVEPMGLIFIDGGHSLETIRSDWKYCQELMDDKTIVIFDDYFHNRNDTGCKPIIDNEIDRTKFHIDILEPIDYITDNGLQISVAEVIRCS